MGSRFEHFTSLEKAARTAVNRRQFIGGSDARIIMSPDEAALIRLWKEKRGEVELEDLSGHLIAQLGAAKVHSTGVRCRAKVHGPGSLFTNSSRLGCFPSVGLAEAHAHSSAVFVDELDTTRIPSSGAPLPALRDAADARRPRAGAQSRRLPVLFPRVPAGSNQEGRERRDIVLRRSSSLVRTCDRIHQFRRKTIDSQNDLF